MTRAHFKNGAIRVMQAEDDGGKYERRDMDPCTAISPPSLPLGDWAI